MDIAYIDQLSNNSECCLRKASTVSKIVCSVLLLVSVGISDSTAKLAFIFAALVLVMKVSGLPLLKIIHFSLYPAFFGLLFAASRFAYSLDAGFSAVFKAIDSAVITIMLVTTTPYTRLFSFLRLFLPSVIVDGMFFTYRIFFILISKIENILTVVRLRGGFRPSNIIFNVRNLAGAIGIMFMHCFDMQERMYDIYRLRGYEGKMYNNEAWCDELNLFDLIPLAIGLILFVSVVLI